MEIREAVQQFLTAPEMRHTSEQTMKNYSYILDSTLTPYCQKQNVPDLETLSGKLADFCQHLEQEGIAGSTIQMYLGRVRQLLKHFDVPHSFTYRVRRKERMERQQKAQDRWFTESDMEKIMAHTFPVNHTRNHLMLRIMAECGARVGELITIRKTDLYPEDGAVWLPSSKTRMRWVIPSPETMDALMEYARTLLPESLLFPVTEKHVYAIVSDMLCALGMKNGADGRSPHTFRHWCATWMVFDRGVKVETVAMLLGDTPQTIWNEYLHPTPKMLKKQLHGVFA